MAEILSILDQFKPISLKEMDSVKLLDRIDTKFICNESKLPQILDDLKGSYKLMHINNRKVFGYKTIYYDTADNKMYIAHHNRKLNRYKIRERMYMETKDCFLEMKFKNSKGQTIKSRIQKDKSEFGIQEHEANAVINTSPFCHTELEPKLQNQFQRFTITNTEYQERITIDNDLSFKYNGKEVSYPGLAIIEVKQEKGNKNPFLFQLLKSHGIYPSGMSKYCIGALSVNKELKHNQFKEKLLTINKIIN